MPVFIDNFVELIKTNRYAQIGVGFLLIASVILVIGLNLSGNKSNEPVAQTFDTTPIKLVWWKPFYGSEAYEEILTKFKALPQNQGVEIELVKVQYDDNYYKKLIQDMVRGNGPDIFTIRNDDLPAYKEFLTPLSGVRNEKAQAIPNTKLLADYQANFTDLVVNNTIDRNQIYTVTSYVDNLQMYYNEDILAQAGIALPPATWRDLDKQLSKLNILDTNGQFKQHAISLGTSKTKNGANVNRYQDILSALSFQYGGSIYDYTSGQSQLGNTSNPRPQDSNSENQQLLDPTLQAIKFYNSFQDINSNRYSWNGDSNNNIDAFAQGSTQSGNSGGKLAYILNYSYFKNSITNLNPRLKYKVAPIPQVDPNNKKTYGFFFADGINKKLKEDADKATKDPVIQRKLQVAKDFLYYLSTQESQSTFNTKTQTPAAHKKVIDAQLLADRDTRIFAEGSLYAQNYYKPDVKKTEELWGEILYRNQYEAQNLDESYQKMTADYSQIINAGPILR
jgi:ABC-type glycerol-3-phosphate transport system substrate-binding protein